MKNLMALFLLALLLISCGKDNQTPNNEQVFNPNGNCRGTFGGFNNTSTSCIPQQTGKQTSWEILNRFDKFPSKVLVRINGQEVINECSRNRSSYPARITRSRDTNEVKIFVERFQEPNFVSMEIVKLGKKCFWWSSFYYQGDVRFTRGTPSRSRPADVNVILPQR